MLFLCWELLLLFYLFPGTLSLKQFYGCCFEISLIYWQHLTCFTFGFRLESKTSGPSSNTHCCWVTPLEVRNICQKCLLPPPGIKPGMPCISGSLLPSAVDGMLIIIHLQQLARGKETEFVFYSWLLEQEAYCLHLLLDGMLESLGQDDPLYWMVHLKILPVVCCLSLGREWGDIRLTGVTNTGEWPAFVSRQET